MPLLRKKTETEPPWIQKYKEEKYRGAEPDFLSIPNPLLTSSARWAWGWLSRKVPSRTEPTMVRPFPALSWEVSESSCGCTTFWSWSTRTSTSSWGLKGVQSHVTHLPPSQPATHHPPIIPHQAIVLCTAPTCSHHPHIWLNIHQSHTALDNKAFIHPSMYAPPPTPPSTYSMHLSVHALIRFILQSSTHILIGLPTCALFTITHTFTYLLPIHPSINQLPSCTDTHLPILPASYGFISFLTQPPQFIHLTLTQSFRHLLWARLCADHL